MERIVKFITLTVIVCLLPLLIVLMPTILLCLLTSFTMTELIKTPVFMFSNIILYIIAFVHLLMPGVKVIVNDKKTIEITNRIGTIYPSEVKI